jgi:hypothetical protein
LGAFFEALLYGFTACMAKKSERKISGAKDVRPWRSFGPHGYARDHIDLEDQAWRAVNELP